MIVDGKKIAEDVYALLRRRIAETGRSPKLSVVVCAPNFETRRYLELKKKKAAEVGVTVVVHELPADATTDDFKKVIDRCTHDSDGIIVQLPLPAHVDRMVVLNAIPPRMDIDVLGDRTSSMLSPVVGAIKEILDRHNVDVKEKQVSVIGSGKLVGLPVSQWFMAQGAHVSVVTKDVVDIGHHTRHADIVVLGAGVPGLLKPDMIREGSVILDAGTSEDGGELRGDADSTCATKASLFTPVPGGIGPITIAILLRNVVDCAEAREHMV